MNKDKSACYGTAGTIMNDLKAGFFWFLGVLVIGVTIIVMGFIIAPQDKESLQVFLMVWITIFSAALIGWTFLIHKFYPPKEPPECPYCGQDWPED